MKIQSEHLVGKQLDGRNHDTIHFIEGTNEQKWNEGNDNILRQIRNAFENLKKEAISKNPKLEKYFTGDCKKRTFAYHYYFDKDLLIFGFTDNPYNLEMPYAYGLFGVLRYKDSPIESRIGDLSVGQTGQIKEIKFKKIKINK